MQRSHDGCKGLAGSLFANAVVVLVPRPAQRRQDQRTAIATFGDYLFGPMRDALKRYAMWDPPPIAPDWADDSWARGAAALATQRLFDFESSPGEIAGTGLQRSTVK
ncbi:hypothetical protein A9K71_02790 [Mesorhizobium sp. WSM3873]|nr:hypothetical protein A9K71_02790 [Mesorhizobium sp. WSM3873]